MRINRLFFQSAGLLALVGLFLSFRKPLFDKPEDNRFTPVVLTPEGALDEPMMFQVLPDGTAYIIERKGGFKALDPVTGVVTQIAKLPVYVGSEQGLIGLELDPNFKTNHWIYLLYAHLTEENYLLERHELVANKLVPNSKKVLLTFHVDRNGVNHPGGGMCWDTKGNLYITTPNNSGNQILAQVDERPGFFKRDDQRTSANTNDLRGKILRIHPEADGTYSIPAGNLFPPSAPNGDATGGAPHRTRPEIYTMGHRNPWRVSVDTQTGWVYWGEIGPDKDNDGEDAPRGYDEFNQAKGPGNFGWPYFIGNNIAYPMYDFANDKIGPKQNPLHPINKSPNNTGLTELPPAQSALVWYPYAPSEEFPLVGSSSRCAVGGPIYHQADFTGAHRPFPAYYEGKWLAADLSRFWIMAITMDKEGNYQSMERFAPNYHPVQPIDIKFSPSGELYVLEYGGNTAKSGVESKLVKIEYTAGNRKPFVQASASQRGGAVPFKTTLSSQGTKDYDGDALRYEWKLTGGQSTPRIFTTPNPTVTFTKAGVYTATLTVTDSRGAKNSQTLRIISGNAPPRVTMRLTGNQTFFFDGSPFQYAVTVSDQEDGSLATGKIAPAAIATSIDYASEGLDFLDVDLQHQLVDATTQYAVAQTLMSRSDCNSCHTISQKVIGPAYQQIAAKYQSEADAVEKLAKKIRTGGSGVWGEGNMPAHPSVSLNDARTIVNYILHTTQKTAPSLPVQGLYTATVPADDNGRGTYILRTAYQDKATKVPAQVGEDVIILRSPVLIPTRADVTGGGAVRDQLDDYIFLTTKPGSYIGYKHVDVSNIRQVEFRPNWHIYDIYRGGTVEVRLDSPTGALLGETSIDNRQFNLKTMGLWMNSTPPKRKTASTMTSEPSGHGALADMQASQQQVADSTSKKQTRNLGAFFQLKDKNEFIQSSTVLLSQASGFHDLYFVFRNPDATPKESLFPLAWIRLHDRVK